MQSQRRNLFTYAVGLMLIGLASVLYTADTGKFGWNPEGATGLYICGGLAIVVSLLSGFAGQGQRWAVWAGLIIAFLMLSFGGSKVFSTFRDLPAATSAFAAKYSIPEEAAAKRVRYRGALMGALAIVSLGALMRSALYLRSAREL